MIILFLNCYNFILMNIWFNENNIIIKIFFFLNAARRSKKYLGDELEENATYLSEKFISIWK